MAIDFRTASVHFDPTAGQVQEQLVTVVFDGKQVLRAGPSLTGFDIQYDNGDHEVFRERLVLSQQGIRNDAVDILVSLLLRDASGNIDDPFSGDVDILVVAEVA